MNIKIVFNLNIIFNSFEIFRLGLAFDSWDLDFYTDLFLNKLKRNPTSVECFDLAQSNSEHSRHWFFKGRMIIDGEEMKQSLIDMIVETQNYSNPNNTIKFSDNSSAIKGFHMKVLRPMKTHVCSSFHLQDVAHDLIFTAETHNFPTGVAPFRYIILKYLVTLLYNTS